MSIEPKTHFFASLSPAQYIAKMHHPVLRRVQMLNIMAEMDLLALVHEYRLQIVQGDMRGQIIHCCCCHLKDTACCCITDHKYSHEADHRCFHQVNQNQHDNGNRRVDHQETDLFELYDE